MVEWNDPDPHVSTIDCWIYGIQQDGAGIKTATI